MPPHNMWVPMPDLTTKGRLPLVNQCNGDMW